MNMELKKSFQQVVKNFFMYFMSQAVPRLFFLVNPAWEKQNYLGKIAPE